MTLTKQDMEEIRQIAITLYTSKPYPRVKPEDLRLEIIAEATLALLKRKGAIKNVGDY